MVCKLKIVKAVFTGCYFEHWLTIRYVTNTCEASMKEVSWLICSLGRRSLKKTEVTPEPQMPEDLMNSMHRCCLMRRSSGGISMGKHGDA